MLRLKDLSLAKIILGAIGFGSLAIGIIGVLNLFPTAHFEIKPLNLGVLLGGLIFELVLGLLVLVPEQLWHHYSPISNTLFGLF